MQTTALNRKAAQAEAAYPDERSMVQELSALLTSQKGPVRCSQVASEFNYSSGRADLVGLSRNDVLHAFEAKLLRWREAFEQARRNACFAHYCYVALPKRAADLAIKARDDFRRHGVGLLVLTGREARLAIRPRRNLPLLPWLTKVALARLNPEPTAGG
jgi:phosphoglycolate phosphatase-like HAD superfamily hydrolase